MFTPWSCSQRNMGELLEPTNMQKGFMRATCRCAGGQGVVKNGRGADRREVRVGVGRGGLRPAEAPHSAAGCLISLSSMAWQPRYLDGRHHRRLSHEVVLRPRRPVVVGEHPGHAAASGNQARVWSTLRVNVQGQGNTASSSMAGTSEQPLCAVDPGDAVVQGGSPPCLPLRAGSGGSTSTPVLRLTGRGGCGPPAGCCHYCSRWHTAPHATAP